MGLKWHEGEQTISIIGWTKNFSWYKKIKSLFKDSASIWIGPLSIPALFINLFALSLNPFLLMGMAVTEAHVTSPVTDRL